jgi:hypothetical protein
MRNMANFNLGSLRIQRSALSSEVVVGYARFAWPWDREARAAADLTAKQVSQLAQVVKKEFGGEKTDV